MEIQSEREGIEFFPSNIGDLPSSEAAPLLDRAASRLEIARPKTKFWQGLGENLKGAAAYIEALPKRLAPKTFRAFAGVTLVGTMISACAPKIEFTPIPTLEPTTEVFEPTPITFSTPEITAIDEITSTPTPEPLPTETVTELAEKLNCGETGCIYEMFPPPDQQDIIVNAGVEVLATGRIERVQLFDPESGEIIGTADTVLAVTKDAEDKPLVLKIAVQMMSIEEPNINLLAILTNYLAGKDTDVSNNTPYSTEDLEKMFPIGRHLSVGFSTNSFYTNIPDSEIVSSLYKDVNYISLLETFVSNRGLDIDTDSLFIIPTSFSAEDIEDLIRNNTEVLPFQNKYEGHIALSVPGMPENIATSVSSENMRLDSDILDALNEQGYSPVVSSARNSLGLLLTIGDKRAVLINSPERLINYERAGRLGSEQGTVYYGRYGESPLVYLLTLIPYEQDEGIYSAGAFVTSNVSGQEIGSFVIIFFDADTGKVIQTLPAEFPENRNLRIEWQENGPVVYVDGQKQEY